MRFRRWDPPTDRMRALLEAVAGRRPATIDVLAELDAALPVGPLRDAADAELLTLLREGRIAQHGADPLRYSYAADATARTRDFAVAVTLQSGPAPPMALPHGKFVYALPVAKSPRLGGVDSGWIVVPPTDNYQDVVEGGQMLLVHWIPDGRIGMGR